MIPHTHHRIVNTYTCTQNRVVHTHAHTHHRIIELLRHIYTLTIELLAITYMVQTTEFVLDVTVPLIPDINIATELQTSTSLLFLHLRLCLGVIFASVRGVSTCN